jgi:uncharacterized protein (DUF4415 family)
MGTVRRRLEQGAPRKLSAEAKARHDAMRDEEIDHSETPDLGDVDWAALQVDMPRAKPTVTMRLDEDVIGFFKAEDPKGYTGRMAAVLTAYARAQREG